MIRRRILSPNASKRCTPSTLRPPGLDDAGAGPHARELAESLHRKPSACRVSMAGRGAGRDLRHGRPGSLARPNPGISTGGRSGSAGPHGRGRAARVGGAGSALEPRFRGGDREPPGRAACPTAARFPRAGSGALGSSPATPHTIASPNRLRVPGATGSTKRPARLTSMWPRPYSPARRPVT
jgi:hypothetical protein